MKPKYQEISDDIRSQIVSHHYQIGKMIPTELQLQKAYQVSRHTVREAISILVNEGYLKREKGSGTYVLKKEEHQNDASSFREQKTIGVITTYISDYIFPSIIRGIEKVLSTEGYSLLLASTNNDYLQEKECLEKMIEFGVDGLIVEPTKSNQYNPNLATYVNLREHNIPVLMINATYEEINTPFICVDDVETGFVATQELIENHHQNLLLITKIDDLQGKYRMKGFIKACENNKIKITSDSIITFTTENMSSIYEDVLEKLNDHPEITGIVCYNDKLASSLIKKLLENGKQIPEQYSIVGNDDSTLSIIGGVSLTTTVHPKENLGIDAAKWIVSTIETGVNQDNILYHPTLVKRESVKKL